MSVDWYSDVMSMHEKFGFHEAIAKLNQEELKTLLAFRRDFLREEMRELEDGINTGSPEDVVDALIDLCVVAIGTLDLFGVDGHRAWDAVHTANMTKQRGVKASRPNPLGLPDLIKPEGWVAPDHAGNHGTVPDGTDYDPGEMTNF